MKIPSLKSLSSTRYLVHRALSRFMSKELKGKKFGVVVDIGAGRGPYKKYVNCDKYISLDVENRSGDPDIIIADINEKIPLDDSSVDCVVCTEVLEHLKKPGHALKEIYRVIKPGGMLVLTTPMVWPHHEAPNDFFRYTKFGLEYLLGEAGFARINVKPSNNYFYTVSQLSLVNLGSRVFTPWIIVRNLFAVISSKLSKNYDLPLGHQVTAYKTDAS